MEQQVVSRLHLTEEKIAHQKSFEEKERAEARRQAKLDKIQAKRVCCWMFFVLFSILQTPLFEKMQAKWVCCLMLFVCFPFSQLLCLD